MTCSLWTVDIPHFAMADELLNARLAVPAVPTSRSWRKESPRSAAHRALLVALNDLDATALRLALEEGHRVGLDAEGLAAAEVLLQELPGAIGSLADRQRCAARLELLAQEGSEKELQELSDVTCYSHRTYMA